MDVTQEILRNNTIYGASDYTAPSGLAANKSLNYADGPSIQRPAHRECSVIPHSFKYESDVGLFGAENYFSKVQLKIDTSVASTCFEETDWRCAKIGVQTTSEENYWQAGIVDKDYVCVTTNTYECPRVSEAGLPNLGLDAYVSVDLLNRKTGNRFVDDWVDVRLYTKAREEHPYNRMWVKLKDYFYVGIHARNTRRLPFDISCIVGLQISSYDAIPNKQEVMKR